MTLSSVTMKSWKKVMCNFRHCSLTFKGILPYDQLPRTCGPTDVFVLCKLPKRSNGKDSPCYITYHCLKVEIIDLTGVNIENEWFKPPPSHSDICVFYLTGGRREKIYIYLFFETKMQATSCAVMSRLKAVVTLMCLFGVVGARWWGGSGSCHGSK